MRRLLIICAASLTLVLGAATAAYAGTNGGSSTPGSLATFFHDGDRFEICDTAGDTLLAYMDYQYVRLDGSLQTGTHYNPGSAGECTDYDHNFGEGRTVWFRACVDWPWPFDDECDRWRTATA
jgi:hypothetical protein